MIISFSGEKTAGFFSYIYKAMISLYDSKHFFRAIGKRWRERPGVVLLLVVVVVLPPAEDSMFFLLFISNDISFPSLFPPFFPHVVRLSSLMIHG